MRVQRPVSRKIQFSVTLIYLDQLKLAKIVHPN